MSAVALLDREARSLVQRLRVWTPPRWAALADAERLPGLTRADIAFHLAASFAALAGEAPVPLPRLAADLALPDQLAVTAHDLVRTVPADRVAVDATCHLLLHRAHLLGDAAPAGLADALGVADVLAAGAAACQIDSPPRGAGPEASSS